MKKLIEKELSYIKSIGKTLCIERFDDGTEFYCLLDKNGEFNIVDTGRSFNEINLRIKSWENLIQKGVIKIV